MGTSIGRRTISFRSAAFRQNFLAVLPPASVHVSPGTSLGAAVATLKIQGLFWVPAEIRLMREQKPVSQPIGAVPEQHLRSCLRRLCQTKNSALWGSGTLTSPPASLRQTHEPLTWGLVLAYHSTRPASGRRPVTSPADYPHMSLRASSLGSTPAASPAGRGMVASLAQGLPNVEPGDGPASSELQCRHN